MRTLDQADDHPEELPNFDLVGYERLIQRLAAAGYRFARASDIGTPQSNPTVYLRHDVDLHLARVDDIAETEAKAGVHATYYVPLTQHFNVLSEHSSKVLRRIVELGHDLGLHYDLERYPACREEAARRLEWEVSALEYATGATVRSICMHQPHRGHDDWFVTGTKWVNPHDPAFSAGLVYISDSCRAWRDEALLRCFESEPPQRVLLNIHPELWLDGAIVDREAYLESVVLEASMQPQALTCWMSCARRGAPMTAHGRMMLAYGVTQRSESRDRDSCRHRASAWSRGGC